MIDPDEHTRTIALMRPPKRDRPVIAIFALNQATDVTDLLAPFNVLTRAGVAEVVIVAETEAPVPLHPFSKFGRGPALFSVDPQETTQAFDARWPDGADYVVVPAIEPRNDAFAMAWIIGQHAKGATIVSVCAGALTLAAAGLLDGRRATTHWAYVDEMRRTHPSVRWIPDRRYVVDERIVTATGISASIPVSLALVEAIAGAAKAGEVAADLGVAHWDERHASSAFELTSERKKTFLRNLASFWRRETFVLPIEAGVDEIALAFRSDAWSRTFLSRVETHGEPSVRSRYGLVLRPTSRPEDVGDAELMAPPSSDAPARTADRELERIAARFGRPTADIVALTMEYRWA